MYHNIYIILLFESTIDHGVNILDINNNIDVDTFMYVYDQNS